MPHPRKVPRPAPEGYISTEDALKLLDMSQATFYRYKREFSDFPRPLMHAGKGWYSKTSLETWKNKHMES